MFGNQRVALPEELGGLAFYRFGDTPTKRVVAIAGLGAVRLGDADQAMLTVVTVFGN